MFRTFRMAAIILVLACAADVRAGLIYELIAEYGETAPGLGGKPFRHLELPVVNVRGQVLFSGAVLGDDDRAKDAIFLYDNGAYEIPILEGRPVPGQPGGVTWGGMRGDLRIADDGSFSFTARIDDPAPPLLDRQYSYWSFDGDAPHFVAQVRGPAAGLGSLTYSLIDDWRRGRDGTVAVRANVQGHGVNGDNDRVIWAGKAGAMQIVAREGDRLPAGVTPGVFKEIMRPVVGPDGSTWFPAVTLTDTGERELIVWRDGPSGLEPAIVDGAQVPGWSPGVTWRATNQITIGAGGHLAFYTALDGVPIAEGAVLMTGKDDQWHAPIRHNDLAPGLTNGQTISSIKRFMVNTHGHVAVYAEYNDPNAEPGDKPAGFWAGAPDEPLKLMITTEQSLPGLAEGVTLKNGLTFFAYADNGSLAVLANLEGAGITTANDTALLLVDPFREVHLIAQEGALFDVDPTAGEDWRTVGHIGVNLKWLYDEPQAMGLGPDGTLAFRLNFDDFSSMVFTVKHDGVIPEPGALTIVLVIVGVGLARRRRKIA